MALLDTLSSVALLLALLAPAAPAAAQTPVSPSRRESAAEQEPRPPVDEGEAAADDAPREVESEEAPRELAPAEGDAGDDAVLQEESGAAADAPPEADPEAEREPAPAAAEVDGELPRRVRVGIGVVETADGLVVRRVAEGSPAGRAGIREGDLLVRVGDGAVADGAAFRARMREMRARRPVPFYLRRAGEPVEVEVAAEEVPKESARGAELEYRAFRGTQGRMRAIWTVPVGRIEPPLAAVLIVRGVGAGPADGPENAALSNLARRLAVYGVVAVSYDPAGVGDSEGPANASVDFDAEVADARAALAHLRADSRVDARRVFLVGHGTGGGVAAVVASSDRELAGLAVVGTIARPVMEYLLESRRQQLQLAAIPPGEADEIIRQHIRVLAGVLTAGATPEPDPLGIVAADGSLLGKLAEYWRQYDRVNFGRLYSELELPVLNAIGEYDFVSCAGDHRAIAEALRSANRPGPAIVILDKADHSLRSYDSRDAAYAGLDGSDAPVNDRAVGTILTWVRERLQAGVAAVR